VVGLDEEPQQIVSFRRDGQTPPGMPRLLPVSKVR
jgi:hypothetical protein